MTGFWEIQEDGTRRRVNLRGRFVGWDEDGTTPIMEEIDLSDTWIPSVYDPSQFLPLSVSIQVQMTTRQSSLLSITRPPNLPPRSKIMYYHIYRSQDGGAFSFRETIPRSQDVWADPDVLPFNTPEIVWRYYVIAENADGLVGPSSNVAAAQWEGVVVQQPVPPFNVAVSDVTGNSAKFTWDFAPDASVQKQGLFKGTELLVDNIPANAREYVWNGLQPDTLYNNLNIRRWNTSALGFIPGWSTASNSVLFTTGHGPLLPQFKGHVRGKLLMGWSTSHTDVSAESQLNTQAPLPAGSPASYSDLLGVRRLYVKDSGVIDRADANGRVLWISAKPGDFAASGSSISSQWLNIASGARDANIVSYFDDLVARDKLTIFTFHHEPIGDVTATEQASDFIAAFQRIIEVVDAEFLNHKILFAPNYEENRLRNVRANTPGNVVDWSLWCPEHMLPGRSAHSWDFMSFDMYQYGPANMATNVRQGVQFSHRWWRIDELFTGAFTPNGSSPMPWMDFTPAVDLVYGIGECAARPGSFYWYQNGGGTATSDMTGAKYARDMLDYIFSNVDKFAFISWFNSIGADTTYNDERLYPNAPAVWGGDNAAHNMITQTGDTELTLNIYREKLASGLCNKLGVNGFPLGYIP